MRLFVVFKESQEAGIRKLLRPSQLIECHVSGHFMSKELTDEGEVSINIM